MLFVFREAYYHALQKPDDDQKLLCLGGSCRRAS